MDMTTGAPTIDAIKQAGRLLRAGDADRAEAVLRHVLQASPGHAAALWRMGTVWRKRKRVDVAADWYRQAAAADPGFLPALQDLGSAMMQLGEPEAALDAYRRAAALAPHSAAVASAILMVMNYCASVDARALAAAHRSFGDRFPDVPRPPRRARAPAEPIRVGLVSADFRQHSTASFLPPLLEHRDRSRWRCHLYAEVATPDAVSRRFVALADGWTVIAGESDEAVAARIRADGIDLLIDLNGHSSGNRLGVFARRPAPVQASWLDYIHTTGLRQIDYLLTDAHHPPPGADEDFVERIVRLPTVAFPFAPPPDAPDPGPPPFQEAGHVTFGCLNAIYKLSPPTLATWAEILRAVPGARLVLGNPPFEQPAVRARILDALARDGVEAGRVDLHGSAPYRDVLARYRGIDVALDPFPYGGCLTTLEALWMGVPVLTFPGDRMAGRSSTSVLRHAGLGDFVVANRDAYVAAAIALARNPGALAPLRARMRGQVAASALVDAAAYARGFADTIEALA